MSWSCTRSGRRRSRSSFRARSDALGGSRGGSHVCTNKPMADRVLSFAAVGFHGREQSRAASRALSLLLLAASVAFAQPTTSQDLAADLAARIVSLLVAGDVVELSTA